MPRRSTIKPASLSRRERQIMSAIYAVREATAQQVLVALPDPPGYSAVRALLRILVEKGHLSFRSVQGRYVFTPTHPRARAGQSALRDMLRTFFDNSAAKAVAALLDSRDASLSTGELNELSRMIEAAKKRSRS